MKLARTLTLGILHLSTVIVAGWSMTASQAAVAANFACDRYEGRLATVIKTKKGSIPIVVWDSTAFSNSGYSPENRCQLVTQRFKNFHSSGQLKYLTAGQLKNQPVICATFQLSQKCTARNLLFTLKPGSSPYNILQKLNDIRNRAARTQVVEESASQPPVNPSTANSVDMNDWLKFADQE
jgi:Circadian oscillating protein COP23